MLSLFSWIWSGLLRRLRSATKPLLKLELELLGYLLKSDLWVGKLYGTR